MSEVESDNYVYVLYCEPTNEYYIGRTNNPSNRLLQHLNNASSPMHERAVEFGADKIIMVILKSGLSYKQSVQYEARYIYEQYFNVNLINRAIPGVWNLVSFMHDAKSAEYWCDIAEAVEKDQCSENPRISCKTRKNRSFYSPINFMMREYEKKKKGAA